ncbi:hypothetical protein O1L44_30330 [Streptomyces noursei]|uniref:hypothetical protein n=1 Tax=Streptomyces noursei TaxID=1971 RepID=UPI00081D1B11|nr:hypothetical protein SNOUR_00195 [Streptomyces noursei ATCC 11455]ANZ21973.1 hypothetical protein SNOUR_43755 [Streptomyces noursei ATCC 11455]MCZ0996444.1 hypothetical protein [Streptomyces noursei]
MSKQEARDQAERLPFLPRGEAEKAHRAAQMRELEQWVADAPKRRAELEAITAKGELRDRERAARRERQIAEREAARAKREAQAWERRFAGCAEVEEDEEQQDMSGAGKRRITLTRIIDGMWHATTRGEVFNVAKESAGWVVVAPDDARIGVPVIGADGEPDAESVRALVRAYLDDEPAPAVEEARGEHGYTWADVRRRPAADGQVGDVFVVPGVGTAYEELSDGVVRGTGVAVGMPLDGVAWTITARSGDMMTAKNHRGERHTELVKAGAYVLRVESLRNVVDSESGGSEAFFSAAGPEVVADGVGSCGGVRSGPVGDQADVSTAGQVPGGAVSDALVGNGEEGDQAAVAPAPVPVPVEGNYISRPAARATALDLAEREWAVECDRHGPMTVLVDKFGEPTERRDRAGVFTGREDAEYAAGLHLDEHQRRDAGVMTPEEIDEAAALALSSAQSNVLWWAHDGKLFETADGFVAEDTSATRFDVNTRVAKGRVLTLWAAGIVGAAAGGPGCRKIVLTAKGRRTRDLWRRARQIEAVECAVADNGFGVSAADRRRYPLLSEDRLFKGEEAGPTVAELKAARDAAAAEAARIEAERETLPAAAVDLVAEAEEQGWSVRTQVQSDHAVMLATREPDGLAVKAAWKHEGADGWRYMIGGAASDHVAINDIRDLDQVRRCLFESGVLVPVKVADVVTGPGTLEGWADDGGYCPGVAAPAGVVQGAGAEVEKVPAARWGDGPALVFIASRKSAPARARGLWVVTREEAQRFCSHAATRGRSFFLAWTERPGVEGEDWRWVRDTGSFDLVLAELGVTPRRVWDVAEVERFPESCPRCFDRDYVRGERCAACPTFGRGRHQVASVVQAAADAELQAAIKGALVRAALPAPRYVKGQRVMVTPEPVTHGGVTVQGLPWRGTFDRYETYGRAWVLQDGEYSPVIVPAREASADVAPPEHVTRVFTVPGQGARSRRAGYDPTLDVVAWVTCSCGWSARAGGNEWGACVGWGRAHVAAAQVGPWRVLAPPYVPGPRVFAIDPVTGGEASQDCGLGFQSVTAPPRLAIEGISAGEALPRQCEVTECRHRQTSEPAPCRDHAGCARRRQLDGAVAVQLDDDATVVRLARVPATRTEPSTSPHGPAPLQLADPVAVFAEVVSAFDLDEPTTRTKGNTQVREPAKEDTQRDRKKRAAQRRAAKARAALESAGQQRLF